MLPSAKPLFGFRCRYSQQKKAFEGVNASGTKREAPLRELPESSLISRECTLERRNVGKEKTRRTCALDYDRCPPLLAPPLVSRQPGHCIALHCIAFVPLRIPLAVVYTGSKYPSLATSHLFVLCRIAFCAFCPFASHSVIMLGQ